MQEHLVEAVAERSRRLRWEIGEWVDFRCPNARCHRYIVTVPAGTLIKRGYCGRCGQKYGEMVAA